MNGFSRLAFCLSAAILFVSCSTNEITVSGGNYEEPVAQPTVFTNAELVYRGDDGYTETSDLWMMKLYTDMDIDDTGNPIGAGQLMQISLNTELNRDGQPDMSLLAGRYHEPTSTSDFSAGTFNPGSVLSIDIPDGTIEMPDHSYFGDIPAGTTAFEAILLREGVVRIEYADGILDISGTLVGTDYKKRIFSYKGTAKIIDQSEVKVPNSTLTEDITDFSTLTQTRLRDKGDNFVLGDRSYRMFELMLAEPTVDLAQAYPAGDGRILRLEFFVGWDDDPNDGIPAGDYTVAKTSESGGIYKEDIVPFRIVAGMPDRFNPVSGSWYQTFVGGQWGEKYARIADGSIKVERPDGGHRLTIDLLDCNEPAHRIRGTWESAEPVPVVK
ncbi:MAG: hypothetical protein J6K28_04985 [Alistipes sp.]|nr:hypothetical protein [Alistipes sp.]